MSFAGNVLWFVCGGFVWGTLYLLMGLLACCTVVGIPFGIAIFRFAGFIYFPFGRELVEAEDVGEEPLPGTEIAAFLWVMLVGTFSAVGFALCAVGAFCCVVTIPFGMAYFRLSAAVFNPLGKRAVPKALAEAIRARKANAVLDAMEAGKGVARIRWGMKPHIVVATILSVLVSPLLTALSVRALVSSAGKETSHAMEEVQRGRTASGRGGERHRPSGSLLEASPERLEHVRTTIEAALVKLDASLKVVSLKVKGASTKESNLYFVDITYNTPLYAVGTPFTKWHDKARGLTFPVRGGAWREVTLVAEAGTPVPSTLLWISSGHWRLQAEASPETAFAPYLLKRYADAALVLQGSEADKALRKALGRALDIQAQAEADRTDRRGDPMAAARLKQAEATLKFASATFGTFFRAHAGRWIEQIPETLFETLGTLPKASATKAQATVDTNQLIKEANRRLVIAGHTAKLTAAEVVEHVETEQANVYRLRVKFDQPTYTLGERNSSWGNQNNRAVRLSGLPTWRLVTLRHPSGDTIEINLRMAKPNTRKPDAITLDERGIPGLAFPDDIRARGQTDLLPLVGSSAQKSWENMLEHALTLSQAIYEDAKLRRNDHAAKTRYETNRKALATFQKALKSYAKEQVGKVAEVFPELPSPPKTCR